MWIDIRVFMKKMFVFNSFLKLWGGGVWKGYISDFCGKFFFCGHSLFKTFVWWWHSFGSFSNFLSFTRYWGIPDFWCFHLWLKQLYFFFSMFSYILHCCIFSPFLKKSNKKRMFHSSILLIRSQPQNRYSLVSTPLLKKFSCFCNTFRAIYQKATRSDV